MTSGRLLSKKSVNCLLNYSLLKDDTIKQRKLYHLLSSSEIVAISRVSSSSNLSLQPARTLVTHSQDCRNQNHYQTPDQTSVNLSNGRITPISGFKNQKVRALSSSTIGIKSSSSKREASTQAQQQVEADQLNNISSFDSFRCSDLEIIKCLPGELSPKPSVDKLVFGHAFTDHMFRVDWDRENGWSTPLVSKLHNLNIHPGAKVLHYALEAFEGAKAFRGYDNKIRFFRLDQNIKRLLHSARRLSLPEFDEIELIKCIHKLVELDQDWIPNLNGQQQLTSLYVRPTILGVEPSLGVASSKKAMLYVLLSPVGPYFKTGFKPVSLYADPDFVRAWPGGAGNTKLGSNYAPTIMVQRQAEKLGLQQVLWLYGDDLKLTEVGTMNIFISIKNNETGRLHLVTPPLSDGLILPGITRASILDLARQWSDVICEERYVTIGEIQQLLHEGRIVEMFGAGTACIVCPISSIQLKDGTKLRIPYFDVSNSGQQERQNDSERYILTRRILKAITDIQYGRIPHPWTQELSYT